MSHSNLHTWGLRRIGAPSWNTIRGLGRGGGREGGSSIGICSKNGAGSDKRGWWVLLWWRWWTSGSSFFSQLSLINGAWKNTSQNTHDTIVSFWYTLLWDITHMYSSICICKKNCSRIFVYRTALDIISRLSYFTVLQVLFDQETLSCWIDIDNQFTRTTPLFEVWNLGAINGNVIFRDW